MVGGKSYNVLWPSAVVIKNDTIILPGQGGLMRACSGVALPAPDLSSQLTGYPVYIANTALNGLAIRGNGQKLVGAGAGSGNSQLFQMPIATPDAGFDWTVPGASGVMGGPTMRGGYAYFGYSNPSSAVRHMDVSVMSPVLASQSLLTSGDVVAFPVAGDGELYSLSSDGILYASAFTPSVAAWTTSFSTSNSLSFASPTLDCSRPATGGAGIPTRPGTLYLPLGNGNLVSVIVDSHRLEPTAEWPKYQRDAYNSGNYNSVGEGLNPGCP